MRIEPTMCLGQLAERMGQIATREEAAALREVLCEAHLGEDTAEIPDHVWQHAMRTALQIRRLEPCEWQGRTVFPTLGCTVDGRGPMCGLFASESDARSPDADSLAVAIVTLDSLNQQQAETARLNSDRM